MSSKCWWRSGQPHRRTKDQKHTLVVCNTLDSRGKSFTPASSVDIEDPRRDMVSRSEETHPSKECAMPKYLTIFRLSEGGIRIDASRTY
jgi:hypothetical protein